MADPYKDPEREMRDELLSLAPFDPQDAVAALVELEPEPDEDADSDADSDEGAAE
jgi:hypothetical protein